MNAGTLHIERIKHVLLHIILCILYGVYVLMYQEPLGATESDEQHGILGAIIL